jgi:membrane protein implicated in regulation of membrane protease activity
MDAVIVAFLSIGGSALLLLILSMIGGHLHFGHVHLHLGHGHLRLGRGSAGTHLTLPAIAGFVGAFGFGGAIAASLVRSGGSGRVLLAVAVGLASALPSAWLAGRLMRAAMNINTDATLTSADLIGTMGVVITPVPVGGYGEVRVAVAGQQIKLNARADRPLALGTQVFVIAVPTPTSVLVEAFLS